ncbi:hypothetical protein RB653_008218 [Dictyostelium firmibasis]|uniref:SHSP domain-containing protein n=1 Tax=Dictyostelium firmibasis TaxID=79012 RepID=A0AAN7TZK9_9MYCE
MSQILHSFFPVFENCNQYKPTLDESNHCKDELSADQNLIHNSSIKRKSLCLEEISKKPKIIPNEKLFYSGIETKSNQCSKNNKCLPLISFPELKQQQQQQQKQQKQQIIENSFLIYLEPHTFIHEINGVIHIESEIPGVDKNGVMVDLSNNILTILAKKKQIYPASVNMDEFQRHGKSLGTYKRVLELNQNTVDIDTIKVRSVDGILLITIKKIVLPIVNENIINKTLPPICFFSGDVKKEPI